MWNFQTKIKEVYNYIDKFVGGTFNHAVLHNGCTKTICGTSMPNNYLDTLSAIDR